VLIVQRTANRLFSSRVRAINGIKSDTRSRITITLYAIEVYANYSTQLVVELPETGDSEPPEWQKLGQELSVASVGCRIGRVV
jgi:hypothetical protein